MLVILRDLSPTYFTIIFGKCEPRVQLCPKPVSNPELQHHLEHQWREPSATQASPHVLQLPKQGFNNNLSYI